MINLGKHSYCYGVQRGQAFDVNVGNYTSIAENVRFDCGFNHKKWITTFPLKHIWSDLPSNVDVNGPINIGSDVWIGEDVIIMNNIEVGHGAIIGAGAIITKNVAPYSIVVGANRIVDKRYSDVQIKSLLSICWWNWSDQQVKENAHLLLSDNIEEFINKH